MSDFVSALNKVLGPCTQIAYGDLAVLAFQVQINGFSRRIIFDTPIPGAVKDLPEAQCLEILRPLFAGIEGWPRENPIVVRIFNEESDGASRLYEMTCFINGLEEKQVGNVVAITDPEPQPWSTPSNN